MPAPKPTARRPAVAGLLLGTVIGFGARMVIERLRRGRPSDTHAAKAAVHDALQGPCDTVMLDDSLTDWGEWAELFPGRRIANRGIAGDTIGQVFSRLEAVHRLRPGTVFLLMGTNDLYQARDVTKVFAQYVQVVESLRARGAKPIVQSTLLAGPQYPGAASFNRKVNALNALLQPYALAQGIEFIDLNGAMPGPGAFRLDDGIHLNGAAYKAWARAIEKHLPAPGPA